MCDPKNCKGCIQVYCSIAGWKSVMITPDEVGGCSPYQTGFTCRNKEEAIKYGKSWARDEEIPFN